MGVAGVVDFLPIPTDLDGWPRVVVIRPIVASAGRLQTATLCLLPRTLHSSVESDAVKSLAGKNQTHSVKPMPLILPTALQGNPRHPILMPVGQFYAHKDIAGQAAMIADLVQEIQPVPRSEALRWLCSITKGLLAEGGMTAAHQLQWARQVLPDEWTHKLATLMQSDGPDAGVVFHRRALWFVLQLAILSCRESSPAMSNDEVAKRLGRACFMAGDVLAELEAEGQADLPREDVKRWMAASIVPILDSAFSRIDVDLIGRSFLMWDDVAQNNRFRSYLTTRQLDGFADTFRTHYGIELSEFLLFLLTLFVRFQGDGSQTSLDPVLLDMTADRAFSIFTDDFRKAAIGLLSQTPEELSIRLFQPRQSWAFDFGPIRERPILEVLPGKYCCPDMTLLVRAFADRVYFLLQDAYGKDKFRQLVGELFQEYLELLIGDFAVTQGQGRTYLSSPRVQGAQIEAGDGILYWTNTAAVMEYKAGMLTSRQKLAGVPGEVLQGIEALASKRGSGNKKGVPQLAATLERLIVHQAKVVSQGEVFDLSACTTMYPILVCLDEGFAFHAVRQILQGDLDDELSQRNVPCERVGPLMLWSVRDFEAIAIAARTFSVEQILRDYAAHLLSQPKDFTGTFFGFVRFRYGDRIRWPEAQPPQKNIRVLEELRSRFTAAGIE